MLIGFILFVCLIISKFILNLVRLKKIKMYIREYESWLTTGESKIDLMEHQQLVKNLVAKAGKDGLRVPIVQEMGYGKLASFSADPFSGFPSRIENVAFITLQILKSCVGIYKVRYMESFNPLYWIGLVIFLPRTLFMYLGVSGETFVIKILNLIWWIISILITGVFVKENSSIINSFIIDFFKN